MPSLPLPKPKEPAKDAKEEPKQAEDAWLFDFYLRLPKGFGSVPKDKTPYFSPFPCFRYAGPESGFDVLVAAAQNADFRAKETEKFDKYYPENFRYFVRMAMKEFYAKANPKADASWIDRQEEKRKAEEDQAKKKGEVIPPKSFEPVTPYSDESADPKKRVIYQYFAEYAEPANPKNKDKKLSIFRVYIHDEPARLKEDGTREPGKQIAIIVHRPGPPPPSSKTNSTRPSTPAWEPWT